MPILVVALLDVSSHDLRVDAPRRIRLDSDERAGEPRSELHLFLAGRGEIRPAGGRRGDVAAEALGEEIT
jgi:hypothetical protein